MVIVLRCDNCGKTVPHEYPNPYYQVRPPEQRGDGKSIQLPATYEVHVCSLACLAYWARELGRKVDDAGSL